MNSINSCAVVFPGQGAQKIGMAQDFFNQYETAKDVFSKASKAVGLDLCDICFSENSLINTTEYTQPAILVSEIAMLEVLKSQFGLKPDYFAGHSLGEYTALVAAGVIGLEDAVKIVRERGLRMQSVTSSEKGAMAAVLRDPLPFERLEQICADAGCDIANYNSTTQLVLSGSESVISEVKSRIEIEFQDATVIPLNVSVAFHSRHMKSIEQGFAEFLREFASNFDLSKVSKVLSNCTGDFHTEEELIDSLTMQISMPVKWVTNMQNLVKVTDKIYEVGPQRILGKFFSTIQVTVPSVTDLRSLKKTFSV